MDLDVILFLLFAGFILVFFAVYCFSKKFSDMELKGNTDFRKITLLEFFKKTITSYSEIFDF